GWLVPGGGVAGSDRTGMPRASRSGALLAGACASGAASSVAGISWAIAVPPNASAAANTRTFIAVLLAWVPRAGAPQQAPPVRGVQGPKRRRRAFSPFPDPRASPHARHALPSAGRTGRGAGRRRPASPFDAPSRRPVPGQVCGGRLAPRALYP